MILRRVSKGLKEYERQCVMVAKGPLSNRTRWEHVIGKVMRKIGEQEHCYLVTGVSYDVNRGQYALRLQRIAPPPMQKCQPIPLSELQEIPFLQIRPQLDALTHLVSRATTGPGSMDAVFSVRTIYKEYQFRPLIKYLRSPKRRILIADEAGLGKTIEAGYILVEELAQARLSRVLVLCPSSLRTKWRDELWLRFGLNFEIATSRQLEHFMESGESFQVIASFDSLRARQSLSQSALLKQPIDLLIVDEVHHMIGRGKETLRRNLGLALSLNSLRVVTLSATPLQIEYDDLRRVLEITLGRAISEVEFARDMAKVTTLNRILRLLDAGLLTATATKGIVKELASLESIEPNTLQDIGYLTKELGASQSTNNPQAAKALRSQLEALNPFRAIVIRNRRKDVGELRLRKVTNYAIELDRNAQTDLQNGVEVSISEQSLYDDVDNLLATAFTHVHRRQLASCLPAMIDLLREGMSGFSVWRRGQDFAAPHELVDLENPESYSESRRTLIPDEIRTCKILVDKFGMLSVDSKWDALVGILRRLTEGRDSRKVIVFTQWIPTLRYLSDRAREISETRFFALSGQDDQRHLQRTLEEFRKWNASAVLFATDMLSEGLDLQCSDTVVNYDFPYNPQRVEQRIGRVDRVGQVEREIEIHNLCVKGSIEEEIVQILDKRLNIFREAMGDVSNLFKADIGPDGTTRTLLSVEQGVSLMEELNELGLLSGVEDYLDRELREERSKSAGSLDRLSWLPVVRMLILSTGGRARIVDETQESVGVGPVPDESLEIIQQWAGIRHAALVRAELVSHREENGIIRLAKKTGAEGLFVPLTDPLSQTALTVSVNSFESMFAERAPIFVISERWNSEWGTRVVICKYVYESKFLRARRLTYWIEDENGRPIELTGQGLVDFQNHLERGEIAEDTSARGWIPSSTLLEATSKDWLSWQSEQKRKSAQFVRQGGDGDSLDDIPHFVAIIQPTSYRR